MSRKRIAAGLAGMGIAGTLLAGGVAVAATNAPGTPGSPGSGTNGSVASMPCDGTGQGYGYGRGGGAPGARGTQAGTALTAAAKYLGMTEAQLRTRLQDGASMAQVAQTRGKTVAGLEKAIVAAVQQRLTANTQLTAERRAQLLQRLQARVHTMVTATHEPGTGAGLRLGRADDDGVAGMGRHAGRHAGPMGQGW